MQKNWEAETAGAIPRGPAWPWLVLGDYRAGVQAPTRHQGNPRADCCLRTHLTRRHWAARGNSGLPECHCVFGGSPVRMLNLAKKRGLFQPPLLPCLAWTLCQMWGSADSQDPRQNLLRILQCHCTDEYQRWFTSISNGKGEKHSQ